MIAAAVFRAPIILTTHVNKTSFRVFVNELGDCFDDGRIGRNGITPIENVFNVVAQTIIFERAYVRTRTIKPRLAVRTNAPFDDSNGSGKTFFQFFL